MANLAIRGHAKRGKEVIEILKMFGGKNDDHYVCGSNDDLYYYIATDGYIYGSDIKYEDFACQYFIFTLEEFLEKSPYKVGDRVQSKGATSCGTVYVINRMEWTNNNIKYEIMPLYDYNHTGLVTVCAEDLQPYKEETIEEQKKYYEEWFQTDYLDFENNDDTWADEVEVNLGKDYEIQIRGDKTFIVKKKPQYPKSYEECCNILDVEPYSRSAGYKCDIITAFRNLLICRDAYWKIAGERMGLGKPWEPDWKKNVERKYCIVNTEGNIVKWVQKTTNKILAFPTEEIQYTFYENFKKRIELCKELL